jgi:hypothetical protein
MNMKLLVVAALTLLAGVLIASAVFTPAAAGIEDQNQGRFHVVYGSNAFLMYDSASGMAWILFPEPGKKTYVWTTVTRPYADTVLRNLQNEDDPKTPKRPAGETRN